MPKFKKEKKVVRAQAGVALGQGSKPEEVPQWLRDFFAPGVAGTSAYNRAVEGLKKSWAESGNLRSTDASDQALPIRSGADVAADVAPTAARAGSVSQPTRAAIPSQVKANTAVRKSRVTPARPVVEPAMPVAAMAPAVDPLAGLPSRQLPSMTRGMRFDMPEGEQQELESMMKSSGVAGIAGEIPKTKAGLKKFMQEYGKFIALGAMAGQGGKGGQIAAPIMAALPGLIEMMKGKKKGETMKKADGGSIKDSKKNLLEEASGNPDDSKLAKFIEKRSYTLDGPRRSSTFLDALFAPRIKDFKDVPYYKDKYPKSSGGEPPKKSEGGAIRKFKGGSMKGNSMDSMLTPKYAKGGKTDKMGKAAGEMPQHKKMAMGKPTPQSTGQKFAKGGAAKYAGGGMCKGYGISKKIRPTGPMN